LAGPLAGTLGFDALPSLSLNPGHVYYEPTLDMGLTLRQWRSPIRSRFYMGLGIPISDSGQVGAVARFGGGLSAEVAPHFAFGGDLVWSLGTIDGYFTSALSFAIGPEVTF